MDEHDLLARIKSHVEPDLTAVRPVHPPGSGAAWLLATSILLGAAVVAFLGPRQDLGVLGIWRSFGLSLIEIALSSVLVLAGLRLAIPGMRGSLASALAWLAIALLVDIAVDWSTVQRSVISPASAQEWRVGLRCLGAIVALGLAPFALGAALLASGLLTRPMLAFTLIGFAACLAAIAAWRLHCPYTTWDHTLPFHSGVLVLFVLIGSVAATLLGRRR